MLKSNRSQKKALAPGILDLEKRTEQLLKEIEKLTLNVQKRRDKEIKTLIQAKMEALIIITLILAVYFSLL